MSIDETRTYLQPVLAELAQLAAGVRDDQRQLPAPDEQWNVGQLSGHIIGWLENFADGYASPDGACPSADPGTPEVTAAELPTRIETAAAKLDAALAEGGAERPLVIQNQGGMPGDTALSMILSEYLLHGWDLAVSTGQQTSPDPAAVEAAHQFLKGMVQPEYRGEGGMFGPEVPAPNTADPMAKLLAFSGRDPNWHPRSDPN